MQNRKQCIIWGANRIFKHPTLSHYSDWPFRFSDHKLCLLENRVSKRKTGQNVPKCFALKYPRKPTSPNTTNAGSQLTSFLSPSKPPFSGQKKASFKLRCLESRCAFRNYSNRHQFTAISRPKIVRIAVKDLLFFTLLR